MKLKIKNSSKGITLVEIIVVIFIIALFSMILISDFPTILKQFALSRATYQLSQDLRKTQDLGLSGVSIYDVNGRPIKVKGYGIYISLNSLPATQYIIYADIVSDPTDPNSNSDRQYSGDTSYPLCSKVNQILDGTRKLDCVVEVVDITKQNPNLSITNIKDGSGSDITGSAISINFMPPDPITNITDDLGVTYPKIGIILGNSLTTRQVQVNTSGLINVVQ